MRASRWNEEVLKNRFGKLNHTLYKRNDSFLDVKNSDL